MEIVHLILGKANPARMNGVNKVVYQLATYQKTMGRNVSVWGITHDLSHNYGERSFDTKLFQAQKNPFSIDKELKDALLDKKKDIIIHLHGGWIPVYSTLAKFLHKNQIPFVITPHGAYNKIAMQRSRISKAIYYQIFESHVLEYCNYIHAIGASEVAGISGLYANDKTQLIPYGFDTTQITRTQDPDPDTFVFGFVGRLDIHTKGLDLIIAAFKKFQSINQKTFLWIIGNGSDFFKLQSLIEKNKLQDHVILFGSKYGQEKDHLMSAMNVFVHPSRNEGLPSSVIEASSLGIPSIVSIATNIADLISKYNAGISISNESVEELHEAMHRLHEQWLKGELSQMQSKAISMVKENFSWPTLIEKFDELYL
jgi:glycosyltransferase involved in cell wall biosynthesis